MKIVIELPSKNEALITVITMALFLLLTGVFIGLRSEHFLMVALYLVLFFAGLPTRKLALALLPFAIFGISYDWMRICPNYEVNPIDVAGLYNLEKSLFGVMDNGILITPCEYFAAHNWPVADVFAGIFYRVGRYTYADDGKVDVDGSRAYPVRSLPVLQEAEKNISPLCVGISAGQLKYKTASLFQYWHFLQCLHSVCRFHLPGMQTPDK